jgi:hypothetical protein
MFICLAFIVVMFLSIMVRNDLMMFTLMISLKLTGTVRASGERGDQEQQRRQQKGQGAAASVIMP